MLSSVRIVDGNEWESKIQKYLKLRYGLGEYQEVPDTHSGDFGIEGFACDGSVFQCYAAEEPVSTQELYEKQRDKITKDIRKFIQNRPEFEQLLSGKRIRRWILVVPRFESARLLLHAAKKQEEVKAANLPYVADDFEVRVITEDYFAPEIQALTKAGIAQLDLPLEAANQNQLDDWSESHSSLVQKLDGKVAKLDTVNKPDRPRFRNIMIRHFLQGQNALSKLRASYPDLYEEAIRVKNEREGFLEAESMLNDALPSQTLKETIGTYQSELARALPGIGSSTAKTLAFEAASDWLLRCPLDFQKP